MASSAAARITKELFLEALGCGTRAWRLRHAAGGEAPGPGALFRMQQGQEVHQRARGLFPKGVFAGTPQATATLLADPSVKTIFEAAIEVDGYAARADILHKGRSGHTLAEVKSGLHSDEGPSDEHLDDLAYTLMVLRRAGVPIARAELMLLSRDWRLGMPDDALFVRSAHTRTAGALADERSAHWDVVRKAVRGKKPPKAAPIFACGKCEFYEDDCLGKGVEHPIFDLPRLTEQRFVRLTAAGIRSIREIPMDYELTPRQTRVWEAVRTGKVVVDQPALRGLLKQVRWPAAYLDFETVMSALPLWTGVAPHEQVVTQYSLHICPGPGTVGEHRAYLADPRRDCRRELAERLIADAAGAGSVVVYSSFEKTTINGLARLFPDLAPALGRIVDRIFDLEKMVKDGYYNPGFRGRSSIKKVLPVMVPGMGYDGLEIGDGDAAIAAFARMARGECDAAEEASIRKALLAYCAQDTLAMVRLHEVLDRAVVTEPVN